MFNWDHFLMGTLQYSLLLLTYIFARIIASPFIWELYPYLASGICLGFIVFYTAFFVVLADIIAVFGAMMALPPYITKEKAAHIIGILKRNDLKRLTHGQASFAIGGEPVRSGGATASGNVRSPYTSKAK